MNIRAYFLLLFMGIFSQNSLVAFTVHVLLDKKTTEDIKQQSKLWTVQSSHGFYFSDPCNPSCRDKVKNKKCVIRQEKGALWVGDKKLAVKQVKIDPVEGVLSLDGRGYTGSLLVMPDKDMLHLVNSVDLEEYVCCVLRAESWPGWPLEVNKAFAIMHRSYVVAKITKARGKKKLGKGFLYDIGCTNLDQTYKGTHSNELLRTAVEETQGVVLAHKKKPIMAMYDCCCGGLIPSQMDGVDFVGSPYLARSYACTFCRDCKVYSWKASYTLQECSDLFKNIDATIAKVADMKVTATDKAGIVREVKVKVGKEWKPFTCRNIYSLFKDVKSNSFSVSRRGSSVVFHGRGYGHHLGLCQWGAWKMVEKGWTYAEVLDFYYPSTSFMKLVS